jgi:glycerol uptake facilitator-like aquaporin
MKFFGTFELWPVVLFSGIDVALPVKWFVKISRAHFNPAVDLGFSLQGSYLKNLWFYT